MRRFDLDNKETHPPPGLYQATGGLWRPGTTGLLKWDGENWWGSGKDGHVCYTGFVSRYGQAIEEE